MNVLKGNDVYNVTIDSAQLMTRASADGSIPARPYWRGRYAGKGFTVNDPKFIEDWDKGNVAQISLEESSYLTDQDDPENPGQKLRRPSMNFSGYATWAQYKNTAKNNVEVELTRVTVLRDLKLTSEDLKALQAAF